MNKIKKKYYTISGITVCMETPWEEEVTPEFEAFCEKSGAVEYLVKFEYVEMLETMSGKALFENQGFSVFLENGNRFIRRFHDVQKDKKPYAIARTDFAKREITVSCLPGNQQRFGTSQRDFFYIGWESVLMNENKLILHASCIRTPFGGILFSGPSGIGKSTQADLWCQYTQSELLNGDKPILGKAEDGWYAYGSPYAGSSKCHVNERCKIRTIVLLNQGKDCFLRKISVSEAFKRIYAQVTNNNWDQQFVQRVIQYVIDLMTEIQIYELTCTPDENAVNKLLDELKK